MSTREEVWPSAGAYSNSLRDLQAAFPGRPDLAGGTLRKGNVPGFPWSAAGANAIVFSLTTEIGRRVAVRCFTRQPQDGVADRYRALGRFLGVNPCPVLAGFEWMDDAIVIDGVPWPMLQMEWIDGRPLKPYVLDSVERPDDIRRLGETWRWVVTDLETRGVAHGDLQHGNVMVSTPDHFRLVDLDGVWCSSTAQFGSREVGLPGYQHPQRGRLRAWDHQIDRFSAIVVYVSLRAIAAATRPSDLLADGDSLVLSADDLVAAADENARDEAWEHLLRNRDVEVRRLAEELHAACRRPLDAVPSLDELIRQLERVETPGPLPDHGRDGGETPLNEWPSAVDDALHQPIANAWGEVPEAAADPEAAATTGPVTGEAGGQRRKRHQARQRWDGAGQEPAGPGPGPAQPGGPTRQSAETPTVWAWVAIVIGVLMILGGAGGQSPAPLVIGAALVVAGLVWKQRR